MEYYVETDENNELIQLHLDVHRIDNLLLKDKELMGLFLLLVSKADRFSLVKCFFTDERIDWFVNQRILSVDKDRNKVLITMKNKYYKKEIIKYYSIHLNFKSVTNAEAWAIQNGYIKDENMISSLIFD